jgi:hypothetical protein
MLHIIKLIGAIIGIVVVLGSIKLYMEAEKLEKEIEAEKRQKEQPDQHSDNKNIDEYNDDFNDEMDL